MATFSLGPDPSRTRIPVEMHSACQLTSSMHVNEHACQDHAEWTSREAQRPGPRGATEGISDARAQGEPEATIGIEQINRMLPNSGYNTETGW